jgi:hypothetical protein
MLTMPETAVKKWGPAEVNFYVMLVSVNLVPSSLLAIKYGQLLNVLIVIGKCKSRLNCMFSQ